MVDSLVAWSALLWVVDSVVCCYSLVWAVDSLVGWLDDSVR